MGWGDKLIFAKNPGTEKHELMNDQVTVCRGGWGGRDRVETARLSQRFPAILTSEPRE